MNQKLALIALIIDEYDKAIKYYTEVLSFELLEDTRLSETKRWVVVRPRGNGNCSILLARAVGEVQEKSIGNQSGGRVFLFLHTDNFHRDFDRLSNLHVEFVRPPAVEDHGKVAVFKDAYGNLWDLIEPLEK
ncbi:MAG TPA: VOC family protein [Bacteroidia bacterium]|nr:VOC family protein [Bacteroidia bacterium]